MTANAVKHDEQANAAARIQASPWMTQTQTPGKQCAPEAVDAVMTHWAQGVPPSWTQGPLPWAVLTVLQRASGQRRWTAVKRPAHNAVKSRMVQTFAAQWVFVSPALISAGQRRWLMIKQQMPCGAQCVVLSRQCTIAFLVAAEITTIAELDK